MSITMHIDPETKALQDAIFLRKVARARQMSIAERLSAGPRLFDQNCQIMRANIQAQHPEFDHDQIENEMDRRLKIARRIDDAGLYRDAGYRMHR